jgi:exosome complex component RRP45
MLPRDTASAVSLRSALRGDARTRLTAREEAGNFAAPAGQIKPPAAATATTETPSDNSDVNRSSSHSRRVHLSFARAPQPWHEGGHCTAGIGAGTRVLAVCAAHLSRPREGRPGEGFFAVAMAPVVTDSAQRGTRTTTTANQDGYGLLCRFVSRTLTASRAVDPEALCVVRGSLVWSLRVSITVLDASDGAVADAAALAALGAVLHLRRAAVEPRYGGATGESDPNSVTALAIRRGSAGEPLAVHHRPVNVSYALLGRGAVDSAAGMGGEHNDGSGDEEMPSSQQYGPFGDWRQDASVIALMDPCAAEESVADGALSVAVNALGEVCSMKKAGGIPLAAAQLVALVRQALPRAVELNHLLDYYIEADERETRNRLGTSSGMDFDASKRGDEAARQAEADAATAPPHPSMGRRTFGGLATFSTNGEPLAT